jgi:hypothetical protein
MGCDVPATEADELILTFGELDDTDPAPLLEPEVGEKIVVEPTVVVNVDEALVRTDTIAAVEMGVAASGLALVMPDCASPAFDGTMLT